MQLSLNLASANTSILFFPLWWWWWSLLEEEDHQHHVASKGKQTQTPFVVVDDSMTKQGKWDQRSKIENQRKKKSNPNRLSKERSFDRYIFFSRLDCDFWAWWTLFCGPYDYFFNHGMTPSIIARCFEYLSRWWLRKFSSGFVEEHWYILYERSLWRRQLFNRVSDWYNQASDLFIWHD